MPAKKGMAHHIHDGMVKVVFSDIKEAASFLKSYLPNSLVKKVGWDTIALKNVTYVDDKIKQSQSDLLYLVQLKGSKKLVYIYILFEHQSTPGKLLRFRLLKYMCRIWDESIKEFKNKDKLKPILPLVFYQGKTGWNYSKEFSDLVEETDLGTNFIPKFEHFLVDQSKAQIEDIKGELKARVAQLLLLATARDQLLELIIHGNHEYTLVLELIRLVMTHSPELGERMRSATEEFMLMGKIQEKVEMVENMLKEGLGWDLISRIANVTQEKFNDLKQKMKEITSLKAQLGV